MKGSHMKKSYTVLLAALVTMFLQFAVLQQARCAVMLDRVVATVNDEIITWSELVGVINVEGRQQLENLSESERQRMIKKMERPYLNNLIEVKLQVQEARRLGLTVSDAEVEGAIAEIKNKFHVTDADFLESLKAERMTMAEYKARLSEQIMMQKVVNMEVRSKIIVSDDDVQNYYEAHEGEFSGNKRIKIRQIFFAAGPGARRDDVEAKADSVYQKLLEGADFQMMAMEYSEGPNRASGGDLGYIVSGTALKEIEEAAESLNVGEISRPFQSPYGIHIIKLEDRIEGGNSEKAKREIRDRLGQKEFETRYHEWLAELREKAFIEIKL